VKSGGRLYMLYAERGEGKTGTRIRWAVVETSGPPRDLRPLGSAPFHAPAPRGPHVRQIADLALDGAGNLYAATAEDRGDFGPIRSRVWLAGVVRAFPGGIRVWCFAQPRRIAAVDGLKVEALAVRKRQDSQELFIGTDDEDYGGVVGPLLPPQTSRQGRAYV
jgi:hypothetical protein